MLERNNLLPVDSHCHLTDIPGLENCLSACREKLGAVFTCGYSKESSISGIGIAEANPGFVYAVAGESPQRAMDKPEVGLGWLRELKGIAAVGEIGLDKHWGKTEAQLGNQKIWFERQLELAHELGLPVVIHSRDAESEVLDVLERKFSGRVLLHCFSGNGEEAKRAGELGYSATVPPGNSKQRRKVIKALELDYLLLESDAPYLGKTPLSALDSAKMIASEKGVELEEVVKRTSENALKFYGVD